MSVVIWILIVVAALYLINQIFIWFGIFYEAYNDEGLFGCAAVILYQTVKLILIVGGIALLIKFFL